MYDIISNEQMWSKFRKQIMDIENSLYPEDISETEQEIKEIFFEKDAIFIMFIDEDKLIGYICGNNIEKYVTKKDKEYNSKFNKNNTIYVETINVDKKYQGTGIGTKLLRYFIKQSMDKGYKYVTGHYCEGSSTKLAKKFNGKILLTDNDYCDTKRVFNYILITL